MTLAYYSKEIIQQYRSISSERFAVKICTHTDEWGNPFRELVAVQKSVRSEDLEEFECGTWWSYVCEECGTRHVVYSRCKRRDCPVCQKIRAYTIRDNLLKLKWQYPLHIVLTFRSVKGVKRGIDRLRLYWRRLIQRKKYKNAIKKSFGSIEIVVKPGGLYHVHLHVLADCKWIDVHELSKDWQEITRGAGKIVFVKRVYRGLKYAVMEVCKYLLKEVVLPSQVRKEVWHRKLFIKHNIPVSLLDNDMEISEDFKCVYCGGELKFEGRIGLDKWDYFEGYDLKDLSVEQAVSLMSTLNTS